MHPFRVKITLPVLRGLRRLMTTLFVRVQFRGLFDTLP